MKPIFLSSKNNVNKNIILQLQEMKLQLWENHDYKILINNC